MDLPLPPADTELKNIIDKLAQFVARNGPEFEQMTKNKQKDNPKFSFLFGGELFNYYQYKVTTEQAILKLKGSAGGGQQQPFGQNSPNPTMTPLQILNAANANAQWSLSQQPPPQQPMNPGLSLATILEQQNVLQQQITQSEQNLAAQHAALIHSQDSMIEDTVRKFLSEKLAQRAVENGIDLSEFDRILQPIIDTCTKDSISAGKAWILNHTSHGSHDVICEYLLEKTIAPGAPFSQKLHIIYLINDVMHHCVRKNADALKKSLEHVVAPMFCNSWISGSPEQQTKLHKLITLWETKANYFPSDVIQKMKTPEGTWKAYQAEVLKANEEIANPIKLSTQSSYENFLAQHQMFVNHALSQIQTLEGQKQHVEATPLMSIPNLQPPDDLGKLNFDTPPPNVLPPNGFNQPPPALFSHLPPELVPDFSKPPPGFQPDRPPDELVPSVPYYDLPAGLMVTLINIEDFGYKPLDPKKLRLPPALPPSDRLMQAVEAFYQKSYGGTTRDRLILDADGWEKLGLYEYYKAKNAAKKQREVEIDSGLREKSRSPSPIRREKSRSRSPKKKRVYKSKSPSPVRAKSKSRSRSRSPPRHQSRGGKKSPRRSGGRKRSRSRSRTPPTTPIRNRSPTPPSFLGSSYGKTPEEKLDESNKGHQMLRKMGWGGAGLGSKEQGIAAPISSGDVRDRVDQYKGVGVNLHDPYENFRKSKGKAFITRMKARAEERSST